MSGVRAFACVVCTWDLSPEQVVARLASLGDRAARPMRGVVVDNRARTGARLPDGWTVLAGSNTLMDFSAYVEGAAHLAGTAAPEEPWLFLNDSLFTKHHAAHHLRSLLPYAGRLVQLQCPAMAGRVDRYVDQCWFNPWSGLPAYVSTFAFLANLPAVECLARAHASLDEAFGNERVVAAPGWGAGVPRSFREFLRTHVTMPEAASAWYQADRFRDQAAMLDRKARCVYLEHRLSGEVGREGVLFSIHAAPRAALRAQFAEQQAKLRRRLGIL